MNKDKFLAIIQARSTSTRLPGKCFLKFGDETLIQRVYRMVSSIVPNTYVAIPCNDEALISHLEMLSIPYFLGEEENVLGRYYECAMAKSCSGDFIIRITGDCPMLNLNELIMMMEFAWIRRCGFITNAGEGRTSADGEDIEIFSRSVLRQANDSTIKTIDVEHVTPWMYRNANPVYVRGPVDHSQVKTSIDTMEDYERVLKMYKNQVKFTGGV